MSKVLVFGAGQVAHVFKDYLQDRFAAFVVDSARMPPIAEGVHHPFAFEDVAADTANRLRYQFVIGMSFRGLNKPRAEKFELMRGLGYKPATYLAPDGWPPFPKAKFGIGSFIMDRNTIQTGVEIGENCVLWSHNHVGHHTKIGNHVWLSSGIVVSGACEIGDYSFIGSGATIADNIKIGKRCIIGAGATITRDCEDDGVYPGPYAVRSKVPSHKLKGVWAQ